MFLEKVSANVCTICICSYIMHGHRPHVQILMYRDPGAKLSKAYEASQALLSLFRSLSLSLSLSLSVSLSLCVSVSVSRSLSLSILGALIIRIVF